MALIDTTDHENKGSGLRLILDLAVKLNSAFLKASQLDDILKAVLVGVTAGEGLGFNRAFLFTINAKGKKIEGKLAIGPSSPEEAGVIWGEISQKRLSLFEILDNVRDALFDPNHPLNLLVRQVVVPLTNTEHVFVRAIKERNAFHVCDNGAPDALDLSRAFCEDVCNILNVKDFAVAPLYTQEEAFGLIVADNAITHVPIYASNVEALHLFSSLASMAICQINMIAALEEKIAQLKELNAIVERDKDALIEAERYAALGRMADQLVHEIRNPVSVIGGMAKILQRKVDNPSLRAYVDNIASQAGRLEQILSELLDFSVRLQLNIEDVYLYQLVNASINLFHGEIERHNVALHVYMPDEEPVIKIDRLVFQQAFMNILKNAIEAMPDGGMLLVTVDVKDNMVEIQVTDTGLGIAKGHLAKADEPFFTTKTHSMGLGLSLAKRAIESHGGALCLSRNKFGGTTASITLPL